MSGDGRTDGQTDGQTDGRSIVIPMVERKIVYLPHRGGAAPHCIPVRILAIAGNSSKA